MLVKDNIDTRDLPTTAGSLALADAPPPTGTRPWSHACVTAGMVVLGKTNLSEWANIRDEASTSGWSAYGGLTRNPYALNRSAGGSSSGSGAAVAAGLAPYAVGTETDGSITCPAALQRLRRDQADRRHRAHRGRRADLGVAGLARADGPHGPRRGRAADRARGDGRDLAAHAVDGRLAGKRIGVPRTTYWGYSPTPTPPRSGPSACSRPRAPSSSTTTDLPELGDEVWEDELVVLLAEFRAGVADYLATRAGDVPAHAGRARAIQP